MLSGRLIPVRPIKYFCRIFSDNHYTKIKKHFILHKGREFIHVLKGQVSVIVDGVEELIVAGDSIFLKDEIPSTWNNDMEEPAELLIVYM